MAKVKSTQVKGITKMFRSLQKHGAKPISDVVMKLCTKCFIKDFYPNNRKECKNCMLGYNSLVNTK